MVESHGWNKKVMEAGRDTDVTGKTLVRLAVKHFALVDHLVQDHFLLVYPRIACHQFQGVDLLETTRIHVPGNPDIVS
ncbi:UNVERIFIED_CONTAM: hypothetical protein ACS92_06480 [Bacillus cereus]